MSFKLERLGTFLNPNPENDWEAGGAFNPGGFWLGEEIGFTYRATPGHSPDHFALLVEYVGQKIVAAGDALGGGIDKRLGSDLDQFNESCLRLYEEQVQTVFRGHGKPVRPIRREELDRFSRIKNDLKPGLFYDLMDPVN